MTGLCRQLISARRRCPGESGRGEVLTRHLLSFARRQRLSPTAVSLGDHAQTLRELIAAGLPSGVTLVLELPDSLWPVRADPGDLELAVLNLAVNARDALAAAASCR